MQVIALGFFDGVHLGHGGLLQKARAMADELACGAAALTFHVHPAQLLGREMPLLSTPQEREQIMRTHYAMDRLILLHFDEAMRDMPWQDFARHVLMEQYGACGLVCGHDFRFGRGGEGNAEKLEGFCRENGLAFAVIPEIKIEGQTVSSTLIRAFVEQGDMESAMKYLGHPHILTGVVEKGQGLGRTLGIPTANVAFGEGKVIPAPGVYCTKVGIGGESCMAVTNVGTHPTVQESPMPLAESWLLDFAGDLYGREITIFFYKRLRSEKRFPSLEALVAEIRRNGEETRAYFA